jgi:very-short-patch-repair endonuclease
MLMLGGNIAYHIVYQRDMPRDTLQVILAGLARLPDVDDDPAVLFKCLAIVGTSVAFTDCLRGSHIDSDLDTTIHAIAQNIIRRLVVMCLSEAGALSSKGMDANILHAMFPFLAWVVFQSRDLHFLDEEQRRCVHDMFDQSVRVRESMKSKHTVSAAQADMYNTVRNMGLSAQVEQHIRGISVDIVLPDHHIAIEVDGPSHSFRNDSMLEIGHGSFKKAMLDRIGWTLVSIPLETWDSVERRAQSEYMRSVLPI